MKSIRKHAYLFVSVLAVVGLLLLAVPKLAAQQDAPPANGDADDNFNPPPCDFNDQFYADNGIDVTQLIGRFGDGNGTVRKTGPPARGKQVNYVADTTCNVTDPTRRNFRILATTGGNADDGVSRFTCANPNAPHPAGCNSISAIEPETFEFISILAFLNSQAPFAQGPYVRTVGFINGGLQGVQQNPGEDISIGATLHVAGQTITEAPGQTLRGFAMQDIVSNFEAYGALKQTTPTGFATAPCSVAMINQQQDPTATSPPNPCFIVHDTVVNGQTVSNVATPNLRQDWRFATNRNAMDGSDGNNPFAASPTSAPFGYFCDDLLGMWIITYFWFSKPPNTTDPTCSQVFANIGAANGFNLDGTPIILTADELNNQIEANNCGNEGKEAVDGSDGGAVFLICPALPDPRAGAITLDAFLDQVFKPNGVPQNVAMTINFLSLQIFGKFPTELTATQKQQLASAASSSGVSVSF